MERNGTALSFDFEKSKTSTSACTVLFSTTDLSLHLSLEVKGDVSDLGLRSLTCPYCENWASTVSKNSSITVRAYSDKSHGSMFNVVEFGLFVRTVSCF